MVKQIQSTHLNIVASATNVQTLSTDRKFRYGSFFKSKKLQQLQQGWIETKIEQIILEG